MPGARLRGSGPSGRAPGRRVRRPHGTAGPAARTSRAPMLRRPGGDGVEHRFGIAAAAGHRHGFFGELRSCGDDPDARSARRRAPRAIVPASWIRSRPRRAPTPGRPPFRSSTPARLLKPPGLTAIAASMSRSSAPCAWPSGGGEKCFPVAVSSACRCAIPRSSCRRACSMSSGEAGSALNAAEYQRTASRGPTPRVPARRRLWRDGSLSPLWRTSVRRGSDRQSPRVPARRLSPWLQRPGHGSGCAGSDRAGVQGVLHQRVRKAVSSRPGGHPPVPMRSASGRLEQVEYVCPRRTRRSGQQIQLEFLADHGRRRQHGWPAGPPTGPAEHVSTSRMLVGKPAELIAAFAVHPAARQSMITPVSTGAAASRSSRRDFPRSRRAPPGPDSTAASSGSRPRRGHHRDRVLRGEAVQRDVGEWRCGAGHPVSRPVDRQDAHCPGEPPRT